MPEKKMWSSSLFEKWSGERSLSTKLMSLFFKCCQKNKTQGTAGSNLRGDSNCQHLLWSNWYHANILRKYQNTNGLSYFSKKIYSLFGKKYGNSIFVTSVLFIYLGMWTTPTPPPFVTQQRQKACWKEVRQNSFNKRILLATNHEGQLIPYPKALKTGLLRKFLISRRFPLKLLAFLSRALNQQFNQEAKKRRRIRNKPGQNKCTKYHQMFRGIACCWLTKPFLIY